MQIFTKQRSISRKYKKGNRDVVILLKLFEESNGANSDWDMFCYNWPSINPRKDSFVLFDPKSNMIQKLCNIFDIVPPQSPIIFIGPESDHCLPLSLTDSLTDWLTDSCLVYLIDVTLACEDTNSKPVDIVTVANVDDEDGVGNSCCRFGRWGLFIKLNFCSDFEHKVWSRFWSWSSGKIWS